MDRFFFSFFVPAIVQNAGKIYPLCDINFNLPASIYQQITCKNICKFLSILLNARKFNHRYDYMASFFCLKVKNAQNKTIQLYFIQRIFYTQIIINSYLCVQLSFLKCINKIIVVPLIKLIN